MASSIIILALYLLNHIAMRLLLSVAAKKALIGKLKPGKFRLYGWTHQLVVLALDLHLHARSALQSLENTPVTLWWYRGMGAIAGSDAETCPTITALPDMLHLGADSFITTGVATGSVVVCGDSVCLNTVTLEDSSFVGDLAYIGPSARLESHTILGAQSVMPESNVIPAGETWVGNPSYRTKQHDLAIDFLEETATPMQSHEKRNGGRGWRWAGDIATRFLFVAYGCPLVAVSIALSWYLYGCVKDDMATATCASDSFVDACVCSLGVNLPTIISAAIAVNPITMAYLWLTTVLFKWAVLGRLTPGQAPINSFFMARKKMVEDVVKVTEKAIASPFRLCIALPINCWYFRSLGATIGSNVLISEHDTIPFWEMDLMTVADNAILHDCLLQGHTLEDKVIKLDRISVGK